MKKRNLAFVVILGIVTLGIYDVYWLVSTRKEMIAKGRSIPSLWRAILYPLLGIVAGIFLAMVGTNKNLNIFDVLSVVVILGGFIVSIIFGIRFLKAYCQAAEQITNGDLAYSYSFWMGIVLYLFRVGFIWEAIAQYHFNRLSNVPATPAQPGTLPPQPYATPLAPSAPQATNSAAPQAQAPIEQPAPVSETNNQSPM